MNGASCMSTRQRGLRRMRQGRLCPKPENYPSRDRGQPATHAHARPDNTSAASTAAIRNGGARVRPRRAALSAFSSTRPPPAG